MKKEEFKEFLRVNEAWYREGKGYMFIRLDREDSFYRPGDTVKGTVFFELFDRISQDEIYIKFQGM